MAAAPAFDSSKYLTKVNGSDYLEVKWRLVWLRETHPDAQIETEMVQLDRNFAVFRAKVSLPGGGSATGWGSEGLDDFRDYIEKAETKALGRALAALGFGTQFCPDFDFGANAGRVVDAPIDFASTRGRRLAEANRRQVAIPEPGEASTLNQPATQRQIRYVQVIGIKKLLGWAIEGGVALAIESLDNSSAGGWQGLFDPRERRGGSANGKALGGIDPRALE